MESVRFLPLNLEHWLPVHAIRSILGCITETFPCNSKCSLFAVQSEVPVHPPPTITQLGVLFITNTISIRPVKLQESFLTDSARSLGQVIAQRQITYQVFLFYLIQTLFFLSAIITTLIYHAVLSTGPPPTLRHAVFIARFRPLNFEYCFLST